MGNRKRVVRVKVGELGTSLMKIEDKRSKDFGDLMRYYMEEHGCTWTEAKSIYKKKRAERMIAREMKNLNL